MSYDLARQRNALPEPPDQYGNPGPGDKFPTMKGKNTRVIGVFYSNKTVEHVDKK